VCHVRKRLADAHRTPRASCGILKNAGRVESRREGTLPTQSSRPAGQPVWTATSSGWSAASRREAPLRKDVDRLVKLRGPAGLPVSAVAQLTLTRREPLFEPEAPVVRADPGLRGACRGAHMNPAWTRAPTLPWAAPWPICFGRAGGDTLVSLASHPPLPKVASDIVRFRHPVPTVGRRIGRQRGHEHPSSSLHAPTIAGRRRWSASKIYRSIQRDGGSAQVSGRAFRWNAAPENSSTRSRDGIRMVEFAFSPLASARLTSELAKGVHSLVTMWGVGDDAPRPWRPPLFIGRILDPKKQPNRFACAPSPRRGSYEGFQQALWSLSEGWQRP